VVTIPAEGLLGRRFPGWLAVETGVARPDGAASQVLLEEGVDLTDGRVYVFGLVV